MTNLISQADLEDRILIAFYDYAQKGDDKLVAVDVQRMIEGDLGLQRIDLALRALAKRAMLNPSYVAGRPAKYSITDVGYKEVEKAYLTQLEAAESAKIENDPILELEQQFAPAAGRMVTFGDNRNVKEQAIESVEQVEQIIRASNSLDPDLRDETVASLGAWKSLIDNAKAFAVGAFRFLVWDRIKKVIEKGIEDAYALALTGLLITLGTIIVGLL